MMASASLESKKLKLFTRGESSRSAARLSSLVVRRIRMASDWSMTSMKELIGRSFEGDSETSTATMGMPGNISLAV